MADIADTIVKLLLKHDGMINVLVAAHTDHAHLIVQLSEKCNRCHTDVAMVRHISLGLRYCDRCAATLITKARRQVGGNSDLNLTLMLGHVMDEDAWIDLPNADRLRRAQDLVTFDGFKYEPDVPEPGSPEWQ